MFLFNNRMLCIQNVWKKSHLTPAWMEGGVGSQLCEFPSEQACAARSIDLHSLKVSISASLSSGFRLNASSWPMFLLKTLNGAEMAPVRIFHKVFHCLCRSFWQQPLRCRAPNSELVSHERCAGPRGGDIAQLCLGAALGETCVLSSCVVAMTRCSQRSAKEVPWASVLGLEAGAVFSLELQVVLKVGDARWEHEHGSETSHSLGLVQPRAEQWVVDFAAC